METYNNIKDLIDLNIIYCLFPMILWLIFIKKIFKERFEAKRALIVISWFIIIYTIISTIVYFVGIIFNPNEYAFTNRATGPYWWAYWTMLFGSTILPFSLFYKKLASKPLYLLLVVFFMKSGMYFEQIIILFTCIHRDYLPPNHNSVNFESLFFLSTFILFMQGFILAIILLGIIEINKKFINKNIK